MLSLLVASTLIRYGFTPETRATYDVTVGFAGYLPIIGGKECKVDISMSVDVEGQAAGDDGLPRVASEITAFKMSLNKAPMPFTAKNIADFFPRTTISLTPEGKQVKTDAPDKKLPVRLPGLDVKRFPDITYLPLQFPPEGIEEGKIYRFKKPFGDADVEYEVTPTAITDDSVTLKVHLSQTYTSFEDAVHNLVEEKDAKIQVATNIVGAGSATIDRHLGLIRDTKIEADATSHAVEIATKAESDRHLHTTLSIVHRG
jgi:hypothetical protein